MGNTPTCVGKTFLGQHLHCGQQKHPHVCGEDGLLDRCARCGAETPPRVWGRPIQFRLGRAQLGNTPTCVGKTRWRQWCQQRRQKHPHVCGEDSIAQSLASSWLETPPRVWGRLVWSGGSPPDYGNTPTCVGKTPRSVRRPVAIEKHPHVCGEDVVFASIFPP